MWSPCRDYVSYTKSVKLKTDIAYTKECLFSPWTDSSCLALHTLRATQTKFSTFIFNTLRPRQMYAISQTTFSNAFSWMKMLEFRLKCHWNLFPRVQLTIFQQWFGSWLGAVHARSHYLNQWWLVYRRIYASLGLNELILPMLRAAYSVITRSIQWVLTPWLLCQQVIWKHGVTYAEWMTYFARERIATVYALLCVSRW